MALLPGTRIGPYEIGAVLGAGGMGQVYRALDTKLGRSVAIKALPDSLNDPERVARFQREAHVLASLNHPNIAAIYGLEESGGTQFLVLELVEGETLGQRLEDGPIPIHEATAIAKQIADALQAAHEKGIIHRDLKPANIAISDTGQVKVLDFGIAKVLVPSTGNGTLLPPGPSESGETTMLPPVRGPVTTAGVVLGTVAYMAPEQARGREADKRCDVWAFGCVFYEMLTGARAFGGQNVADTFAAVLKSEPDWNALPADVPTPIRTLIRGCLEKDRQERVVDIAAASFVLKHPDIAAPQELPGAAVAAARSVPAWRRLLLPVVTALAAASLAGVAVWLATRPAPARVTRTTMTSPAATALTITGNSRDLAVTPDGNRVVYVGDSGSQLFVRSLDELDPVAVAGGAPRDVFTSPDGQWVGFFRLFVLNKVPITGGPSVTLTIGDGLSRGATWTEDGTVIFATQNAATGLQRVSANGGEPTVLTRPDHARGEIDHVWPEVLPGDRGVLFTVTSSGGGLDPVQIAVLDLQSGTTKVLVRGGSDAHYTASGHLVYIAGGALRAVPFDLRRLEISGTTVPLAAKVMSTTTGAGLLAIAGNGTMVYVDASSETGASRTLAWVDRSGHEELLGLPARNYVHPRLAPDDSAIAVSIADAEEDIWLWEFARRALTRLTFDPATDHYPLWTPDSRRVVFSSERDGGTQNLFWQRVDGVGAAERLTTSDNVQQSTGVSPSGDVVILQEIAPTTGRDVMRLTLAPRTVTPLLQTAFDERNGTISPDGRWLAYEADSSGRSEVYVRPYPNISDGQWQVSTAGGTKPLWSHKGDELFYLAADGGLMTVRVNAPATTWNGSVPAKLLEAYWNGEGAVAGRTYDVSHDGRRFLMIRQAAANVAPPSVIVVQNWFTELGRLAAP
jgi:serine/threonine-protein kinase